MQEELLLSLVVAMAISWLLLSLRTESAQDYIFACFFLICTSSLLKIRWLLGTLALTPPLLLVASAQLWNPAMTAVLPRDAEVHITVAWATGGLMSFVADSYRRCRPLTSGKDVCYINDAHILLMQYLSHRKHHFLPCWCSHCLNVLR